MILHESSGPCTWIDEFATPQKRQTRGLSPNEAVADYSVSGDGWQARVWGKPSGELHPVQLNFPDCLAFSWPGGHAPGVTLVQVPSS
jgi:hypothetical protein